MVTPFLVEIPADVGFGRGAVVIELLAEVCMVATKTASVAAATPAAGETAPLEESPPRLLLLFVVALAFVATVAAALGLRILVRLDFAPPGTPPRVPDRHELGTV